MRPEHVQPRLLSELVPLLGPDAFVTCVDPAEPPLGTAPTPAATDLEQASSVDSVV